MLFAQTASNCVIRIEGDKAFLHLVLEFRIFHFRSKWALATVGEAPLVPIAEMDGDDLKP